jgi:predicted CoA-substrate-specific enzyme activase
MSKGTYFAGIDVGTSYIKVVVIDGGNDVVCSGTERSGADLQMSITSVFDDTLAAANTARGDIKHTTATGFGRRNVSFADTSKTEISCHAKGAFHYFPRKITIIDIGGQDTKIIKIDGEGKRIGFKMNRKCAAGTGTFLEEIAHKLDVPMDEMNALASRSNKDVALGSFCTVFASTEILTRIREGEKIEDMVRSAYESVVKRVIEMDSLDDEIVMTGGVVAHNDIILTILRKYTGNEILTPPNPQLTGAFGAALFAKEYRRSG